MSVLVQSQQSSQWYRITYTPHKMDELRELQNERLRLFRGVKHPGTNCLQYTPEIRSFIHKQKIHSLLDFGCGEGLQYDKDFANLIGLPRVDIDLYDIGSKKNFKLPNHVYDGVIAIDVFQYIPEALFEREFNELYHRTRNIFAVVNCQPSDENSVTHRNPQWWDDVFTSFKQYTEVIYYGKGKNENTKRIYHGGSRIG